jgi:hypothetical protein
MRKAYYETLIKLKKSYKALDGKKERKKERKKEIRMP